MENFTFYNPTKLIFGKGSIKEIGQEISSNGYKNILIIGGKGSAKTSGVYDQVISSLKSYDIQFNEVWGIQSNPTLSKVEEIIKIAKEYNPDAVLAIGGGSVIDTTKAVAAGYFLEKIWDAYEDFSLVKKALPIFTVLTISATGSEMNPTGVITNEAELKKWALVSPHLFPKVSIVDPLIQMSLPWNQTVNGAIDALSHIFEFYFLGLDEETTLSLDEGLISSIIQSTDKLKEDSTDYEARANLCLSATLALNGISGLMINKSGWSLHRIEHGLSAVYPNIAHAEGLAMLMEPWIQNIRGDNFSILQRWAEKIWGTKDVDEAIQKMKDKFKSWGVPLSLKEKDVNLDDISRMVDSVMNKGTFIGIKEFSEEDVSTIFKNAY